RRVFPVPAVEQRQQVRHHDRKGLSPATDRSRRLALCHHRHLPRLCSADRSAAVRGPRLVVAAEVLFGALDGGPAAADPRSLPHHPQLSKPRTLGVEQPAPRGGERHADHAGDLGDLLDRRQDETARAMAARQHRLLVAGWIYIMIVSSRELSSSILLYSPGTEVLSIVIWELWENGQYVELSALGVMLILGLFVLVLLAQWVGRKFGIKDA